MTHVIRPDWDEAETPQVSGYEGFDQMFKGSGSPEGVVAANIGARYQQDNATRGRGEWRKDSGTGTTGWKNVQAPITGAVYDVRDYGAAGDGVTDDTAAIQAACDAAADGAVYFAAGTYLISSKVTIKGNCDGRDATILVSGQPAIAVEVSTGSSTNPTDKLVSRVLFLPNINGDKTGTGWAGQGTGLRLVNAQYSEIHLQDIRDFSIGVLLASYSQNTAYNNVFIGALWNNKVNLQFTPGNTDAATNENCFYGGSLGHSTSEGEEVSGPRQVLMSAATNLVNNNRFYGVSLEGNCPEYHWECHGQQNFFIGCRWETSGGIFPKVLYDGASVVGNVVLYGYGTDSIVYTIANGALRNSHWDQTGLRLAGSGTPLILQSTFSASTPFLAGFDVDVDVLTVDTADYLIGVATAFTYYKAAADVAPRMQVNHAQGEIDWGNGTDAVDVAFYRSGVGLLRTDGKLIADDGIGVGNSAAATTLGSVAKKIEVFDAAGASLGYLAVYDAIT